MSYPVEIKANVEPRVIDAALTTLKLEDGEAEKRSIFLGASGDTVVFYDLRR